MDIETQGGPGPSVVEWLEDWNHGKTYLFGIPRS